MSPFLRLRDILNFSPTPIKAREDDALAGKVAATLESAKIVEVGRQDNPAAEKPVATAAPPSTAAPSLVDYKQQIHIVQDVYDTVGNYVRDIRITVRESASVDIAPGLELVRKIVSQPEVLLTIHPLTLRHGDDRDNYIFQPIHTMIYALRLGLHMHYAKESLVELGLSALLQNIGMFLIPDDILYKNSPLTEPEIAVIRKHPETGRDLLLPYRNEKPWLLETVYQHHERENGQGYPQGIKGDAIIEYAKIIGICDSYEAMTNNRPHKKAILQFNSIKNLIGSKEELFSPDMLKLFLEEMTIYPVGSYVKLNNAAIGRVIATNTDLPMKPVIRLIVDGKGDRLSEEEIVNLTESNVLSILAVISENDLHP